LVKDLEALEHTCPFKQMMELLFHLGASVFSRKIQLLVQALHSVKQVQQAQLFCIQPKLKD
jgi:hypothetical protein